jgi:large subunit ribosomal protein L1
LNSYYEIDISINLGLDPRKPNQSIKGLRNLSKRKLYYLFFLKGVARLPNGTGKKVRVCVFASGQDAEAALAAGADVVGAEGI